MDSVTLRNWFKSTRAAVPPRRLQVTNSTRDTVIATSVEVADSGTARSRGLLGRKALAAGEGLWIVPCESIHTFGMQFALDLVYIDRQHRVRKIRRNVPPWRVSACLTAHSVIELAAGSLREFDVLPGDTLVFSPLAAEAGTSY